MFFLLKALRMMMDKIKVGSTRLAKQDWINAATATLKKCGVDKVKVDPIAKELNVSRGSFYWHFNKRQDLLDAVLNNWQQTTTQDVIDQLEDAVMPANQRLEKLLTLAFTSSSNNLATEQAIRAWGLSDQTASKVIQQVDNKRVEYIYRLLLDMNVAELMAMQFARVIYYTRVGLYAQAVLPDLQERMLIAKTLLSVVKSF
jgi:AcrR family transcriptional regulator